MSIPCGVSPSVPRPISKLCKPALYSHAKIYHVSDLSSINAKVSLWPVQTLDHVLSLTYKEHVKGTA